MPRTAAAGFGSLFRAFTRMARRCLGRPPWLAALPVSLAAGLVLIGSTVSGLCQTPPVKGEASFSASGSYPRAGFKLAEELASAVNTARTIPFIQVQRSADIPT